LESFELTDTEIALLTNLCPYTVDEAKGLIPTLYRFESHEEMRRIIEALHSYKST
jgi:hypothetical protein